MPLQDFRTILGYKLQDTAGKITTPMQTAFVLEAVKRYSRVRARERVQTITGNGTTVTFALAADFEERFSQIRSVEYPVDKTDPSYLDAEEYRFYRVPTTDLIALRLLDLTLSTGIKAYVAYTARHSVDDTVAAPAAAPAAALAGLGAGTVTPGAHTYSYTYATVAGETEESPASAAVTASAGNGQVNLGVTASPNAAVTGIKLYSTAAGGSQRKLLASVANTTAIYLNNLADAGLGVNAPTTNTTGSSVDTIVLSDREAVATLAASIAARVLAGFYAGTTDPTMTAVNVSRTTSGEWLALAKALETDYCRHLGISDLDMIAAASVYGDLDVNLPWQTDRFFHPRLDR
jgi:hypothetical protein